MKLPTASFLMFRQFGVLVPANRPVDAGRLGVAEAHQRG
jgi:hypothetical protein